MSKKRLIKHSLEVLEGRIAPAAVTGPLLPTTNDKYVQAAFNGPVVIEQGQVLNTTGDANSGTYFLYMEKGNALAFFTDLNNNRQVDFNELTGLSLGDGARVIIFSDVHGDIVTNLKETRTTVIGPTGPTVVTKLSLSDSDNNAANDNPLSPGDGRVLLNNSIEKIELRSLRISDLPDQNGDGVVDDLDVSLRKAFSTYSIFGNIYAGRSFGADDGGLIIDSSGATNFGFDTIPTIGSIKTGTAASGEFFSFGVSRDDNVSGTLTTFVPPAGQAGGDINGVKAFDPSMRFNLNTLHAGDGGLGARGGNISNVTITADDSGGYEIIAGNGGRGPNGGDGGSILNFSDLGSQTSLVLIRSGDGGTGTSGAGGNGGDFTFEKFNIRGNVNLVLGNGGDGFTRGGDGASLLKGDFSQPNFTNFLPANATGQTHIATTPEGMYTPMIGTHGVIDFDNDGNGDYVFVTRDTSQLVVMFGDGLGGFRTRLRADGVFEPERYYLSGIRNPEALTVADLNGDGILDIATASSDDGSHGGVAVFLGKFEHEGSGNLTGSEDLDHDGINDFLGFRDARYSALPKIGTYTGIHQVSSIVAGDFNGDGRPELAIVGTFYGRVQTDSRGVVTSVTDPAQVLMFLTGDVERDNLTGQTKMTGQFYADFGSKGTETPGGVIVGAAPQVPYVTVADGGAEFQKSVPRVIIEASALSNTSTNDVVFVGVIGGKEVATYEYSSTQRDAGIAPIKKGSFNLGRVDTDRQLAEAGNAHRDAVDVTLLDFTVFDYGANGEKASDGVADLAVLSQSPELFIVGVEGDAAANGSGAQSSGNGSDNSGNYLGDRGYDIGNQLINIKSVDADGDGSIDDIAVHYLAGQPQHSRVSLFEYQEDILIPDPLRSTDPQTTGAILLHTFDPDFDDRPYAGPSVFAIHYAKADNISQPSFAFVDSAGFKDFDFTQLSVIKIPQPEPGVTIISSLSVSSQPLSETRLSILAGDGGDSQIGNGGKGGSLGGGSTIATRQVTAIDAQGNPVTVTVKDLVGSFNLTASGDVKLEAGDGGNGFAKGGSGGDVTGIVVRERIADNVGLSVGVVTGKGGRGVSSNGGNGGSVLGSSLEGASVRIVTGDGGMGSIGGNGGSVTGNGTRIYDALVSGLVISTGNGGAGARQGGNGGSITNFSPDLSYSVGSAGAGALSYITGDGGDAVSGRGGNGGSILNSSPRLNAHLDGAVLLDAGNGGDGTTGGNGGSISKFIVKLDTSSQSPSAFNALAGHGGVGTAGKGGAGGGISEVTVPSRGLTGLNRVMAGNGGSSAAGKGGDGGTITKLLTGSVEGAVAVVAGAGGHGLTAGGKGGSVLTLDLNLGGKSTVSKGLVIAGAGGDASAFMPNANDVYDSLENQALKAFGGTIGRGGQGGSIVGLTQIGANGAHVDLIAGDGGSTLNYGALFDKKTYAGNGGSVRNITMEGNIGNIIADDPSTAPTDPEDPSTGIDENVPIKSYNNILKGETIARYVETKLRNLNSSLSDVDGNVGIIVGAAGKNKAIRLDPTGAPNEYSAFRAPKSVNGSLVDVQVNNLMSAVAGSVDRIAAIQVVKGLTVFGTISADKGSYIFPGLDPAPPDPITGDLHKGYGTVGPNSRDFLQKDLDTKTTAGEPALEGALIDGAVVTKVLLDARGKPTHMDGVYIVL